MGPLLAIKSGTTSVQGATIKGDFRYFSASTLDLGPTNITGLYSGIDAPLGGYTVYQIGGPNGLNARVASNNTELNTILVTAGATGSSLSNRITWATNTNSIFVNSGTTTTYYFGGQFGSVDNITGVRTILLNTDASHNTSFDAGTGFDSQILFMTYQSDGKILVGGQFTTFRNITQNYLIRLNSDGSKDTSFDIGTGFNNAVYSIAVQSDGKILVGGLFTTFTGTSQNCLVRLNTDGSKDTSFNIGTGFAGTPVTSIVIQSDGKILVGGNFSTFSGSSQNYLIRLNSDGSKDTSFNIGTGFNTVVYSIAVQSDGKILVGGDFTTFTGSSQNRLIRLNSDGSKDTTFVIGTGFSTSAESVRTISIQLDGKILVGGNFTTFTGSTQNKLIRLNTNGSKDTSFDIGTGFTDVVYSIAVQSDGKILVGGNFSTFSGSTQNRLIRLNTDGSKDTTFDIGIGFNSFIFSIVIRTDGKILLGGLFTTYQGITQNRLVRAINYSRDTTFDIGTGFNLPVITLVIQSDRKILVGGQFTTFNDATQNYFVRLNSNGSKDTSFDIGNGFNNSVNSTAVQSDGKILVGGDFTTFTGSTQNRLIRLNSNGSKDASFDIGIGFNNSVWGIAVQSDGKILVGGLFSTFTGTTQNGLIRLNTDGSKDSSFDIGSGFSGSPLTFRVRVVSVQSDGKILVGGDFTTYQGLTQNRLIRLNSDGSKDTSFDIGTGFNNTVRTFPTLSDGKILVGGNFTTFTGSTQNRLVKLNTNGSKDTSFDTGTGFNAPIREISIQSDGKILSGGEFSQYQGLITRFTALLNSDGSFNSSGLPLSSNALTVAIQQ